MVYGRILYNSIKEYTPKFFPTIPYSQTVKPVFGRFPLIQEGNLKLYPNGILNLTSKEDGELWENFSITAGHIKSLCSVFASLSGHLSTSPSSGSISTIIATEPLRQPWRRKKLTRKNSESRRRLRRQLRGQQNRLQLQQVVMTSDTVATQSSINWLYKIKIMSKNQKQESKKIK